MVYSSFTVGLWITPAGLACIYYFLPAASGNPLYSHRLGLIGFWNPAFFSPFVGIHHYLFSPIVDWAETLAIGASLMLIIPVTAVMVNFYGTLKGRWHTFIDDFTVKLLIVGTLFYFLGSMQGCFEAMRGLQKSTHFTDFVIAHSHLTVFGGYVVFALASCYYVWPRFPARHSAVILRLVDLADHPRYRTIGLGLITQGLIQGNMLMTGSVFVDSVAAMKPYWLVRTFAGTSMDVGVAMVGINLLRGKA